MDWYPWTGVPPYPRERDPRKDDPDYYRNLRGQWVKRTEWSADVFPADNRELLLYLEETTPQQRATIVGERMQREGRVRWRDAWVTPERANELEETYRDGVRRQTQADEMRRKLPSWGNWC